MAFMRASAAAAAASRRAATSALLRCSCAAAAAAARCAGVAAFAPLRTPATLQQVKEAQTLQHQIRLAVPLDRSTPRLHGALHNGSQLVVILGQAR